MSTTPIPSSLRLVVKERAEFCCEYCHLPEGVGFYSHEVDHIVAIKHRGETVLENLAFACWRCNRHKGTDLASVDPLTGEIALLFHPRLHNWLDHFQMDNGTLIGLTTIGRATIELLQLNRPARIHERRRMAS